MISVILITILWKAVSSDMFESELNVNDILRTDLMPSRFLVGEVDDLAEARAADMTLNEEVTSVNGSIDAALSTLNFHRYLQFFCLRIPTIFWRLSEFDGGR